MRGITHTLNELRKNYKLAIISGGLQILADKIKEDYKMHYAVGNEILTNNGKVSGIKQIVGFKDKGKFLRKFAENEGITTNDCAAVGDYLNDIPMFKEAGLSIAFNPKNVDIVDHVDEIVYEKNLIKILELTILITIMFLLILVLIVGSEEKELYSQCEIKVLCELNRLDAPICESYKNINIIPLMEEIWKFLQL